MISFIGGFIDNMLGGGEAGTSSLPFIIGLVLAVAFISMLIVTITMLISIKRSETKQKIIDLPPSALKDKLPTIKKKSYFKSEEPLPIGEWLNQFLIARGYISVSNIVKSFFKAMQILKESLGTNYKYKLPWYMVIGTDESGKSSLLSGFTHEEISDQENAPCTWWFLKDGVILDIKGDVFIPKNNFNADEKSWNLILNLLSRYRVHKPLNGIILTIPASEIYGREKKTIEEIKQRAIYMAKKLNFSQNILGMKLPIYIVITKTDIIPGFQSFCSEIPVRNRDNMLGWSCPYPIDMVYSPRWMDECFEFLEDELNEIRLEIFSEGNIITTRDGVFVFPSELLTLKENISIYVDSIFKSSSLEERFYFRGLYFTGDSKMVPLLQFDDQNANEGDMAILGIPDADVNEAGQISASIISEQYAPKKIFFFEDLLIRKILMEDSLASPLKLKLHQFNKSICIAKTSTALFVVIGSIGLFNAKDKLRISQANLHPTLFKISSIIKDIQYLTLDNLQKNGNDLLNESTQQLLSMMYQLNNIRLSSIFVPASWFSNINNDLTEILRISYQRVVVRTIYMNLLLKARELLGLQPSNEHTSVSIAEVLNPYKSKEYQLLKGYVYGLIELEKNIKKFDSLRIAGDPKDLYDLIDYTFQGSLPKEFLENYQQYRAILMNTPFPPIDLSPYKKVAHDVLLNLFQNFLETIFTDRSEQSIISFLNKFINQVAKQNLEKIPNTKDIINFSKDLTEVCAEIGEEGKTWLDNNVFETDQEYNDLLDGVETLFGKTVSQQLLDITAVNFGYLKHKLIEFNNLLDNDVTAKLKTLANEQNNVPSRGIFRMQQCLNSLCKEPYMVVPEQYTLITDIPEGKMIFWDDELIQYAYDIGKKYEQYFSTTIKEFPRVLQEGITLLSRTNLCSVIAGIVAKAQSFVDSPTGITDEITSEEILQQQVSELKGVAPKFVSLLKILRKDDMSFVFGNLRAILNKVGFSLLDHIDRLMEKRKPYYPNNLSFEFWDGNIGAGYQTYSAADIEELNAYLVIQRKTVARLAIDFADTIVTFLNAEPVIDYEFGNQHQLTKWSRIVDSTKSFLQKNPTNSISLLENFIKKALNSYTIDNITSHIKTKDIKKESGDYFLSIIKTIKRSILAKSETLIRKRNISRYQTLHEYYIKHLENKYPFCNYDKSQRVANDADIDQVKEFFKMYEEFGGTPESLLDQIYQLDEAKEVYAFIKKLHEIKLFFGDFIADRYETLKVRVEADFNVNQRNEKNTEYLIDRVFKPSHEFSIEPINPDKSAIWYFGEPVEVAFRWPVREDIRQRPVQNVNDPDLFVDEDKATFQCSGNWALLRFLQKYKSKSADVDIALPNQTILSFDIPLNEGKNTTVYIGITASLPKRPGDATITTVKVPSTTERMPKLPTEIISYSDQSVLTDGVNFEYMEESGTKEEKITEEPDEAQLSDESQNDKKQANIKEVKKSKSVKKNKDQKKNASKKENNAKTPVKKKNTKTPKQKEVDEEQEMMKILESDDVPALDDEDQVIEISEEPMG